ncbi:MAG: hypothetical protein SGPRY_002941 [Prymnesium sp.]
MGDIVQPSYGSAHRAAVSPVIYIPKSKAEDAQENDAVPQRKLILLMEVLMPAPSHKTTTLPTPPPPVRRTRNPAQPKFTNYNNDFLLMDLLGADDKHIENVLLHDVKSTGSCIDIEARGAAVGVDTKTAQAHAPSADCQQPGPGEAPRQSRKRYQALQLQRMQHDDEWWDYLSPLHTHIEQGGAPPQLQQQTKKEQWGNPPQQHDGSCYQHLGALPQLHKCYHRRELRGTDWKTPWHSSTDEYVGTVDQLRGYCPERELLAIL